MKLKQTLSALAVASAFFAGSAHAVPFTMDVAAFGASGAGDSNTETSLLSAFGLTWSAKSTYTDSNNSGLLDVGDSVVDSGSGSLSLLAGAPLTTVNGADNNEGIGTNYSLTFSYSNLPGTVVLVQDPGPTPSAIAAQYNSGTIKIFGNLLGGNGLPTTTTEVMTLDVTGSTGGIGNFTLYTKINSIADDFLFLADDTDFNDIIAINLIGATTDFNNPFKAVVNDGGTPTTWSRTTDLTGDLRFAVPEPGVLALLGLGFAGLGFARRNKKPV